MAAEISFDAIIVGAGFSGVQMLQHLRQNGFNVKLYEAGGDFGGVWYWNCYPGARVDLDHQTYQFTKWGLWKDFDWGERYPGQGKLREYFHHVDQKLKLSKDIQFNTRVTAATFNDTAKQWTVKTEHGDSVRTQHLILCTGYASKVYTPPFEGIEGFQGSLYHSSRWPQSGVNLNGKRVAVIGTGASGVQIIQEIAPIVSHLTVYQRTPNMALPMQQYSAEKKPIWQKPGQSQEDILERVRKTFFGANMELTPISALQVTEAERQAKYEELFQEGGLSFMLSNYWDVLFNLEANQTAYNFWCEKTRARINDPVKRDILAPLEAPHTFAAKRLSLEQRYFEVFNQDNVDIINVTESPIIRIAKDGIVTQHEGVVKADVIILATGFDSYTGGILSIEITNGRGETLQDKWKNGTKTFLGIAVAGFPNLSIVYGPHAPTAFANGPVCAEIQGEWIADLLVKMKNDKNCMVETSEVAEENWTKQVNAVWYGSIFAGTESWYQGSNIPGKPREALNYFGGIPEYVKALQDCKDTNFEGFVFS